MTESPAKRAVRRLNTGYKVALALVVVILGLEHVSIQASIGRVDRDAQVVRLSGRQAALGQQAAKHIALAEASGDAGFHRLRAEAALRELDEVNAGLVADADLTDDLRAAVDRTADLNARLRAAVRAVAESESPSARRMSLSALDRASEEHRRAAQSLTLFLGRFAVEQHAELRWMDLGLFVLVLVFLGAVVAAWILPSNRHIAAVLAEVDGARARALAAADARASFTANVSHELRTPLNGIMGMSSFLRKTKLTPRQAHYADVIVSSAETLRDLVNDVLDFSKVQAGAMSVESVELDVVELVERVALEQVSQASLRNLDLLVDVDPALDGTVRGDPLRLRQCLANLVSNAIKFTNAGFVRIEASRRADDEVVFSVTDSGCGVAPSRAVRIFEAFQQEDSSTTRQHGGTGLGLAITRRLARLMGGDASYQPVPSGGSRFWFSARLPPCSTSSRGANFVTAVLLLGVSESRRRALAAWLRHWRVKVWFADGPEQARGEADRAKKAGQPIGLMVAEGRAWTPGALRKLLTHPSLGESRCLLMSVPGSEVATMDIADSEIDQACWPLGRDRLRQALTAAADPVGVDGSPAKLRVLLVEDNPINQEIAAAVLEELGCEVEVDVNGRDALERFEAGQAPFDLVLMDWHMPVMDGLEATRAIRETDSGVDVPIVALSAGALDHIRDACLEAGMDEVLGKPIEETRLSALLDSVGRRMRTPRPMDPVGRGDVAIFRA